MEGGWYGGLPESDFPPAGGEAKTKGKDMKIKTKTNPKRIKIKKKKSVVFKARESELPLLEMELMIVQPWLAQMLVLQSEVVPT